MALISLLVSKCISSIIFAVVDLDLFANAAGKKKESSAPRSRIVNIQVTNYNVYLTLNHMKHLQ